MKKKRMELILDLAKLFLHYIYINVNIITIPYQIEKGLQPEAVGLTYESNC